MEFNTKGNEKLGKCSVVSRAVGETCPKSCEYLNNGCYAEFTELRFPNARLLGLRNIITDRNKMRAGILYAIEKNNGFLRLHERGDFYKDGKLDQKYLANWVWAIKSVLADGKQAKIWLYTHIYDKRIAALSKLGVKVYASVHSIAQMKAAAKKGFKLFAYISKEKKGSKVKSYRVIGGRTFLVCPNLRLPNKPITCCGGSTTKAKDSIACKYCCLGLGNVEFLDHSTYRAKDHE